jgi:hypothetical protein
MPAMLLGAIGKVLMGMAVKMMASAAIEEMILWSLRKLVQATDSKADDQLLAIVEKHLKGED